MFFVEGFLSQLVKDYWKVPIITDGGIYIAAMTCRFFGFDLNIILFFIRKNHDRKNPDVLKIELKVPTITRSLA
jgi:hypothetical protein